MEMNGEEETGSGEGGQQQDPEQGMSAGKKKIFMIAAAVCFAGLLVSLSVYFMLTGAGSFVRKGNKLLKDKRYREAVNLYQTAIQKDPRIAEAWMNLGLALDSMGDPDRAIEALDRALILKPKKVKAWVYKGNAQYGKGMLEDALRSYDEAIRLDPKYPGAWANEASVLRKMQKYEESGEAFRKYIELAAKDLKFDVTPAVMEEAMRLARPLIEEITGLKFMKEVDLRIITPDELGEIERKRLVAQSVSVSPGADRKQIELNSRLFSEFYSEIIPELYEFADGNLYMVPDTFQRNVVLVKPSKDKIRNIMVLLVAHDMVHALDDQNYGISARIIKPKSQDELGILESIVEGHAVFVARKVAEKMGLKEEDVRFGMMFTSGDLGEASVFDEGARQVVSTRFKQIYVRGEEFIKFVHEKEGNPGITRLFNSPPKKLSAVMQPQLYYEKELLAKEDYFSLLSVLERVIAPEKEKWQKQGGEINEMLLRAGLSTGLTPKEIEETLKGFNEGYSLTFAKGNTAFISAALLMFRENKDAASFLAAEEKSIKSKWERIKGTPGVAMEVLQDIKLDAPPAGKTVIKEVIIAPTQNQRTYTLNMMGTYKNFECEFTFVNCKVNNEQLAVLLSALFKNLEAKLKQ